jgi:hypothetical protein
MEQCTKRNIVELEICLYGNLEIVRFEIHMAVTLKILDCHGGESCDSEDGRDVWRFS